MKFYNELLKAFINIHFAVDVFFHFLWNFLNMYKILYSKQYLAFQCFLTFVVYVTADIGLTAGQNQYLPPNKGYNYDRPSIPFGSAPPPQTVK